MSRKNAQRARPRSLGKRLTPKQAAFVHHFSDRKGDAFGNATRASERAGYAGEPGSNQLAVQGWRNLRHPEVQGAMRAALAKQGFTPEFAAKTLMGAMRATVVRALPNRKGKPVLHKFPDHRTRLQGLDRAWRITGAIGNKQGYGADEEFEPDPMTLPEFGIVPLDNSPDNLYAQMSPEDRMFTRSWLEKGRRAQELQKEIESRRSGSTQGNSEAGGGQPDRPPAAPSEKDHEQ